MIAESTNYVSPVLPNFGRTPPFPIVTVVDPVPQDGGVLNFVEQPSWLEFQHVAFTQDWVFDLFYNRFHFDGSSEYAFGLVSGNQTVQFKFWAAFFSESYLDPIIEYETDGVYLDGITSPSLIGPLAELLVSMTVTNDGPPIIDGAYTFPFVNGFETAEYTVSFTGQRVLVWDVPVDWAQSITETYEYRTTVLTADTGTEQRVRLRDKPRSTIQAYFTPRGKDVWSLQRALSNQDQVFAIPYWPDRSNLSATAIAGSTAIEFAPAIPQLVVGDTILVEVPSGVFAFVTETVGPSQVTVTAPLPFDLPEGSKIWRSLFARIPPDQTRQAITGRIGAVQVSYDIMTDFSQIQREFEPDRATYRGLPVFDLKPDWSQGVDYTHVFERSDVDFGGNNRSFYHAWPYGVVITKNDYKLFDRERVDQLIGFFCRRAGRAQPFWFTTGVPDMEPIENLDQGAAAIRVDGEELGRTYEDNKVFRNLEVVLNDGTVFYRTIESFIIQNGYTEMVLSEAWPQFYAVGDIRRVSWLLLTRFESDKLTIERPTSTIGIAALPTRTLRDD